MQPKGYQLPCAGGEWNGIRTTLATAPGAHEGIILGKSERAVAFRRSILLFFWASLGVNIAVMLARFSWWAPLGLLAGWYLVDMLSGLVHMLMDYRPCPAGLGLADIFHYTGSRESEEYLTMLRQRMARLNAFQRIAYDFKNHHPRPDALGRRDLWRQIGSTVIAGALPLSLALNLAVWLWPVPGWAVALGVAFLVGGAFAQYFHGCLHRLHNPWYILALRRLGLLMTPAAHQLHHDTLQRDFATNCGWSNPVINALFRALYRRGWLKDEGLVPAP